MQIRPLSSGLVLGAILTAATQAQIQFQPASTLAAAQEPSGSAAADLNGDGVMDLAVATDAPDKLSLFFGTGGGSFGAPVQVFLGNNVSAQAVGAADMDGDGDTDLVVTLKNSNSVVVVTNQGGSFVPGAAAAVNGDEPRRMTLGDVDGDGDMDAVIGNRNTSNVSVMLNNGGSLAFAASLSAGAETRDVVLGDLDGDGDLDLVAAGHDSRTVHVFSNLGGTFAAGPVLSTGAQLRPDGLELADLDGDGDLDLAAATSGNGLNFVSTWANTAGAFGVRVDWAVGGQNPGEVAAADLDLDGDLDLVTTNKDSSNVSVLTNSGNGTFGPSTQFAAGFEADELTVADLDGNGSADLAVSNKTPNTVTLLFNSAAGNPGTGLGVAYCSANPNSTGQAAQISASGSSTIALNNLTLRASNLPQGQFGYFLMSQVQDFVPLFAGSQGNLCIGLPLVRFSQNFLVPNAAGQVSLNVDMNNLPQGTMFIPGAVWNFQYWYRDLNPGNTSNTTNGVAILFL